MSNNWNEKGEKEMKYTAIEAINKLIENPKLKFRFSYSSNIDGDRSGVIVNNNGSIAYEKFNGNKCDDYVTLHNAFLKYIFELIPQPVIFMEAVKAYAEKKTIKCISEYGERGYRYYRTGNGMVDDMDSAITPEEILEGKWYIED